MFCSSCNTGSHCGDSESTVQNFPNSTGDCGEYISIFAERLVRRLNHHSTSCRRNNLRARKSSSNYLYSSSNHHRNNGCRRMPSEEINSGGGWYKMCLFLPPYRNYSRLRAISTFTNSRAIFMLWLECLKSVVNYAIARPLSDERGDIRRITWTMRDEERRTLFSYHQVILTHISHDQSKVMSRLMLN